MNYLKGREKVNNKKFTLEILGESKALYDNVYPAKLAGENDRKNHGE